MKIVCDCGTEVLDLPIPFRGGLTNIGILISGGIPQAGRVVIHGPPGDEEPDAGPTNDVHIVIGGPPVEGKNVELTHASLLLITCTCGRILIDVRRPS